MTLALEPMLTAGNWRTRVGADGWVVTTADHSLSAHFEHTIAITKRPGEVQTARGLKTAEGKEEHPLIGRLP
jgi:methionyl aminopeptidase